VDLIPAGASTSGRDAAGTARVLGLDAIGKSFRRRRVLNGATVYATSGRITALLGRNGCGKSTLLRIATGAVTPDFGQVSFAGRPVPRPRLHRLSGEGLFYLPERGLIVGDWRVGDCLDAIARRYGGEDRIRIEAELRLGPLLERLPEQLSTGERRRAELALALLRRPRCLLADEPFQGLAPIDAEAIATAFRTLAAGGCAVLVTGHEVPILLDVADEVVWMAGGTTHALGAPREAVQHGSFMRDYLGPSFRNA
jgi:lipopolysaccharide export system ATP-binding protein